MTLRCPQANLLSIYTLSFIALVSSPLLAAEQLPALLRPSRDEITPTFWEQYRLLIILAAFVVAAFAVMVFLLTRPQRLPPEPPEMLARRGLKALQFRSEDGALIMETSCIFRRYVIFAFDLPHGELTTAELNHALQSTPKNDPALVAAIGDFLRQCDEEKFASFARPPRADTATRALDLLETIEARRRLSSRKESAA